MCPICSCSTNGIDAIPEILRVSPNTNIIMLSGFASHDLQQMALDAVAVAHVEKGAIDNPLETLAEWAPLLAGRTC